MRRAKRAPCCECGALALLMLGGPCFARSDWVTLQNCHYLVKGITTAIAFTLVSAARNTFFGFILWMRRRPAPSFAIASTNRQRITRVTPEQAVQVGELAKTYTREKLTQPFLVRTCWQDAMGRSRLQRFYAIVQTNNGDLGEQLIEKTVRPGSRCECKPWKGSRRPGANGKKLTRSNEKQNRKKVGGWGVKDGRVIDGARGQRGKRDRRRSV